MKSALLLSMLTAALFAQLPLLTTIHANRTLATMGPNGDIWIAGRDEVVRCSAEGKILASTRINGPGEITALAVSPGARAVITKADYLYILDREGSILITQPITGVPAAMAIDNQESIYITGRASAGFSGTPGAFKTEFSDKSCGRLGQDLACDDAYLMKRNPDGTLAWATLLGGTRSDSATAVALDPTGSIWVAGETASTDFPATPGALQPSFGGGETLGPFEYGDAFLVRIDAAGTRLEYATYLGGKRFDRATALAVDGNVIVVGGSTESPDFPVTPGAWQSALKVTNPNGLPLTNADAFVTVIGRTGSLLYSTYYGDEGRQSATACTPGPPDQFAISLEGTSRRCLAQVDVQRTPFGIGIHFTPQCVDDASYTTFVPLFVKQEWLAVGQTGRGLAVPGVDTTPVLTLGRFASPGSGPRVAGAWGTTDGRFRPLAAADSFLTIYPAGNVNLESISVLLGSRSLPVLYRGSGQINAHIPAGIPPGTYVLTLSLPFFSSLPVPIDIVERWPALADSAMNENGSINSPADPAALGSVVSLYATGIGPSPYPVIEPYIEAPAAYGAQGMELIAVTRVADGLFVVKARIPRNAKVGNPQVRVVLRVDGGFLLSNLVTIAVR